MNSLIADPVCKILSERFDLLLRLLPMLELNTSQTIP